MTNDRKLRAELAAAFRWAARLDYHEATANHFSVAVSGNGREFLINPRGRSFSQMRASDLALVGIAQRIDDSLVREVDPTAWILHSHLHRHVPQARCVLHTHMPYTTALACLRDFEFLMLDQNACRFYNRIAYDRNYSGMALEAREGERVASLLGDDKSVLFLGNHGVIVIAGSVAQAFDELYYLEKAAQLQIIALSTGRELALIPNEIASLACKQWQEYPQVAELHFNSLMEILDSESSDFRN
jgi:ribulose-5-phosphate 4-epimerase/fuculose-1-phosphate aldolase